MIGALACPFCGSVDLGFDSLWASDVRCDTCGAIGPDGGLAAWNRRQVFSGVDIDAVHDRQHVHYLGGSGHGGAVKA